MDKRGSRTRIRLIKVYRRDIILSSVIVAVGIIAMIAVGYMGFKWIVESSGNLILSIPLMHGETHTTIQVCFIIMFEVLILNCIAVFLMRIRYIYKKIRRGESEAKMFRRNIIKDYLREQEKRSS